MSWPLGRKSKDRRQKREDRERGRDDTTSRRCEHCGVFTETVCQTRNCYGEGLRPTAPHSNQYVEEVEFLVRLENKHGGNR